MRKRSRLLLAATAAVLLAGQCVAAAAEPGGVWAAAAATRGTAPPRLARFVVGCAEHERQRVAQRLAVQGYHILGEGPGFFAVGHPTAAAAAASPGAAADADAAHEGGGFGVRRRKMLQRAAHARHVANLGAIPGVASSEQDVRRHLHARRLAGSAAPDAPYKRLLGHWHANQGSRPKPYDPWGADVADAMCASRDTRLAGDAPEGEVVPWGIKEIGAWNEDLRKAQPKGRAIVCIVDSGIWLDHQEYRPDGPSSAPGAARDALSGCKPGANCPFTWSTDLVSHGTHVAGTIGAPRNGVGVVGVISEGAELHVVRIWNDTGDVSQGQGPYATDLVLAYSNCLKHLEAEQAKAGGKKVNMVINMSYGSAGPLTVERLWMERAAKRGDVLFVGSAGNNGSWLDSATFTGAGGGGSGQYLSYPASYKLDEVLSVANARCDLNIEYSSQKNKQVSLAAPGMAILSSVPAGFGAVRASITTEPHVVAAAGGGAKPGGGAAGIPPPSSRGGTPRGLGYLSNGFKEPRPIQGTRVASTPTLPLALCSIKSAVSSKTRASHDPCPAAKGGLCLTELPGQMEWYAETCLAMLQCVRSGGKGLVVWREEKIPQAPEWNDPGFTPMEVLLGTQLNCGIKCPCWGELQAALGCEDGDCGGKAPPGIVVSARHAAALIAAGAGDGKLKASISNYDYNYRYFDGTSMAAPHVSGAAALLWRLFPDCSAADIANALKLSAQPLPGQTKVPDLAAGHGMLKVDRAHEWLKKHRQCAQGR